MDGAQACYLYLAAAGRDEASASRRAWGLVRKRRARACVERPLVQILVAVATIQMRTLKTEVEKGSMGTAVGHG